MKIIDTCEMLPLNSFIMCAVDNDLSVLNAKTEEDAQEAWGKIKEQYANLSGGDESYGGVARMLESILKLSSKIYCFEVLSELIATYNSEILHLKIDDIAGVKGSVIQPEDGGCYLSKKAIAIYKSWKLSLGQYEVMLVEEAKKNNGNKGDIGRGYFQDILMPLSKDMGFAIQEKDITTYQFAKLVGDLRKKAFQQQLKRK